MSSGLWISIPLALIMTALYLAVVLDRRRALQELLDRSLEIREDLSNLVRKASRNQDLRSMKSAALERLDRGQGELTETRATLGWLDRAGLSIRVELIQMIEGRLSAARTALETSSGLVAAASVDSRRMPQAGNDLPYLLLMMVPFVAVLKPVGMVAFFGLSVAFLVWTALRLWSRRLAIDGNQLWPVLEDISIFALVPAQEQAQQMATLDLIDRLGEAFRSTGEVIGRLDHAVQETPQRVQSVVEAKMAERASIAGALSVLGGQSEEMRGAIEQHAEAISAIPSRLSDSVANEIRSGVEPTRTAIVELKDEIASSYNTMSSALQNTAVQLLAVVQNLGDAELYERWLDKMGDSNRIVADLGVRLDTHFKDATHTAKVLHDVAEVVGKTQTAVTGELQELARLNQLRGVDEKLFAQKIHDLFRANLEKIEHEHRKFRGVVEDFIRKAEQDATIRESLRDELPTLLTGLGEVRDSLATLVDRAQGLPELYSDILNQIQERAAANEKELYGILHGISGEFQKDYREFHEKVVAQTARLVESLRQETESAHRLAEQRLAAQQANLQALDESVVARTVEIQDHLQAHVAALDTRWEKFTELQSTLHGRFLDNLEGASSQYVETSASAMKSIENLFRDLSAQARTWHTIQTELGETHATLQEKLAETMTRSVADGVLQISQKLAAQAQDLSSQTVENQDLLADLISQVKAQANDRSRLDQELASTIKKLSRPQPFQIAQTVCLAGILGILLFSLMGFGS